MNLVRSLSLYNKLEGFWANPARNERLKWAVIGMVVLASLGIGLRPSLDTAKIILVLIAGVCGLIALLRWPNLGLLATLLGAFFISFSGPGGINVAILAIAGISALWILDMIVRRRKIMFTDRRTTIPIFVFIVCSLISFGIGQFPWYPLARHASIIAQLGGLMISVLSVLAFLVVANTVTSLRWLQAFTWLFVAIGAIYLISPIVRPLALLMRRFFQESGATGSLFWVWMLVISFSQALLNRNLKKFWRIVLFMITLGVLYVAIIRHGDWKSGYIPPLFGMAVIIALLLGKRVIWVLPFIAVAAFLIMNQALATDQYSTMTRLEAWKIVLQLSNISPIFGLGFANYYWYTPLKPILGWHVSFNSHNQYVDIYSQTGLAGLICFFWLFIEIGRLGMWLRDRVPEGFARAYVYGALGGLAGTLLSGGFADWILPFAYNIGMNGFRTSVIGWLFLGGLVSIKQIVKKPQASESPELSIER